MGIKWRTYEWGCNGETINGLVHKKICRKQCSYLQTSKYRGFGLILQHQTFSYSFISPALRTTHMPGSVSPFPLLPLIHDFHPFWWGFCTNTTRESMKTLVQDSRTTYIIVGAISHIPSTITKLPFYSRPLHNNALLYAHKNICICLHTSAHLYVHKSMI